jgi:TorA maturation chaperone TorD
VSVLAAPPDVDVYTACYDLLARYYLNGPAAVRKERLPATGSLIEALGHINAGWPARVENLLALLQQPVEREQAHTEYTRALALPVPGCYAPPYASVYLDDGMLWGPSTLKIQRLYQTEGLFWERGGSPQTGEATTVTAPDHVGVEFAFLALVTNKPRRGPAEAKRQQRLSWFLGEHLNRWLPAYRDALAEAGAPTLKRWTSWAVDLVDADLSRRASSPGS